MGAGTEDKAQSEARIALEKQVLNCLELGVDPDDVAGVVEDAVDTWQEEQDEVDDDD